MRGAKTQRRAGFNSPQVRPRAATGDALSVHETRHTRPRRFFRQSLGLATHIGEPSLSTKEPNDCNLRLWICLDHRERASLAAGGLQLHQLQAPHGQRLRNLGVLRTRISGQPAGRYKRLRLPPQGTKPRSGTALLLLLRDHALLVHIQHAVAHRHRRRVLRRRLASGAGCFVQGPQALAMGHFPERLALPLGVAPKARPNRLIEARPNSKAPGPAPGVAYHPSAGPSVSPLVPPHSER
jgi:hypothetical protein